MKKEFIFLMFALCFAVWVIVVDNLIIPDSANLMRKNALYSRYRIKEWKGDGKYDLIKDKIIIYGHSKNAEEFYYLEYKPHYEQALKGLAPGTPVSIRYSKGFPKVWQRTVYEIQSGDLPILRFSGAMLKERQAFNWKFSGIMGGAFLLLSLLGFLNKPKSKRR